MAKKKRKSPKITSLRDWPVQSTIATLLGILTVLAFLTSKWSILIVSVTVIILAYMLKKEWEE